MLVLAHIIMCHVYVIIIIARRERVHDVERSRGNVVADEQGVPLGLVDEFGRASGVVVVEVVPQKRYISKINPNWRVGREGPYGVKN